MIGDWLAPSASVWRAGRDRVGKHLWAHSPIQRRAAGGRVLHPENLTLMMSFDAAAPRLDADLKILLERRFSYLPGEVGRHGACLRIAPLMMLDIRMLRMRLALGMGFSCLKPGIVDALALGHLR